MYPVHDMDYIYTRMDVDEQTGCWNWNRGLHAQGYGQMGGKNAEGFTETLAHRYSFYLYYGVRPLFACHICNNRKCVNPNHLYNGDAKTNANDQVTTGTQARGSNHGQAKLTEEKVIEIRKMYATGTYTQKEIATIYDVALETVRSIIIRQNWTHVE